MGRTGYDFYLEKCLLPVPPAKLKTKINNANETITLINEGEVNLLKTAKLTDIEFDCEIPQVRYPYAVYKSGFQDAAYFLAYFEKLKTGKKPFQFIVSRTLPDGKVLFSTNMKVSLEEYTITEAAEQGFDLIVTIKLKQWREYGTKMVTIKETSDHTLAAAKTQERPAGTSPAPEKGTVQTYTVAPGDCLWSIAKKFYGNGAQYTAIYQANKDVVGGNPNLVYAGQVLTIPAV